MKDKYHFLGKSAPAGYIAGVGRGASGFITRSDIGPAIIPTPAAQQDPFDISYQNEEEKFNADELQSEVGLLSSSGVYDAEDAESDRIYASIDARMEQRHSKKRKQTFNNTDSTSLRGKFEDLKRGISSISSHEWASIPEVADLTALRRKSKPSTQETEDVVDPNQRYTPMPDFIIEQIKKSAMGEYFSALDTTYSSTNLSHSSSATRTSAMEMKDGILTDFASLGTARKRQLGQAIDTITSGIESGRASSSLLTRMTPLSTEAYMTGLTSIPLRSTSEIRDLEKAKILLRSLVETNPLSISGWLSLIRLYEGAGSKEEAKNITKEALKANPRSEDIWIEASRLESVANTRMNLLRQALKALPRSPRLWLRLADTAADAVDSTNAEQSLLADPNDGSDDQLKPDLISRSVANDGSNTSTGLISTSELKPNSDRTIGLNSRMGVSLGTTSTLITSPLNSTTHMETLYSQSAQSISGSIRNYTSDFFSSTDGNFFPPRSLTNVQKVNARLKYLKEGLSLVKDSLELWKAAIESALFLDAAFHSLRKEKNTSWLAIKETNRLLTNNGKNSQLTNSKIHATISALEPNSAKTLLEEATAVMATIPEFWIMLAEIQDSQEASRAVLNKARAACPLSHEIWIASACIEEVKYSNLSIVDTLLRRMLSVLSTRGHKLSHEKYLQSAIDCDISGAVHTAAVLVRLTAWHDTEREESRFLPMELLQQAEQVSIKGHLATARALVNVVLEKSLPDEDIWLSAISWEQRYVLPTKIIDQSIDALRANGMDSSRVSCPTTDIVSISNGSSSSLSTNSITSTNLSINTENSSAGHGMATTSDICRVLPIDSDHCHRTTIDVPRWPNQGTILPQAIISMPTVPRFWLMAAKDAWIKGYLTQARSLLQQAFVACPESDEIWLAAAKIERMEGNALGSREILQRARVSIPHSSRIWIKSAQLERAFNNLQIAASFLCISSGTTVVDHLWKSSSLPKNRMMIKEPRLWLMLAETLNLISIHKERTDNHLPSLDDKLFFEKSDKAISISEFGKLCSEGSHPLNNASSSEDDLFIEHVQKKDIWACISNVLAEGCKLFPSYAPIWITAGVMEQQFGTSMKARAIYEHGRLALPKSDMLWIASIRMEAKLGNRSIAKALLSKALQTCPTSGILWAESIRWEQRSGRKRVASDALRKCPEDAIVALALARVFWEEGFSMAEKTMNWIERSIALNPLLGDAHAYALLFEQMRIQKKKLLDVDHISSPTAGCEDSDSFSKELRDKEPMANDRIEAIVKRCIDSEPKYGELWISISKDPLFNNRLIPLSTRHILEAVVDKLAIELDLKSCSYSN